MINKLSYQYNYCLVESILFFTEDFAQINVCLDMHHFTHLIIGCTIWYPLVSKLHYPSSKIYPQISCLSCIMNGIQLYSKQIFTCSITIRTHSAFHWLQLYCSVTAYLQRNQRSAKGVLTGAFYWLYLAIYCTCT